MTPSHTPTELRPCPFCGSKPHWTGGAYETKIECTQCKVEIPASWYDMDAGTTMAAWNTRTPDHHQIIRELVGALEAINDIYIATGDADCGIWGTDMGHIAQKVLQNSLEKKS